MPDPWFQIALITVVTVLAGADAVLVWMIYKEWKKGDQP